MNIKLLQRKFYTSTYSQVTPETMQTFVTLQEFGVCPSELNLDFKFMLISLNDDYTKLRYVRPRNFRQNQHLS